ncbi:MAG: putative secreted protein [uncultured Friedmanniella sp.]|uniref:Putative secreted protein n=1 Tax=uncultured Friedmanniella sp. TaxID=335381 RepID=A0A6J4KXA1_9ACTN|nr:M23 family metallopeptidase [uncultured Friedmanniella sp.]CAA9316562.1 MAG: putative secreted protein [uncultured Friedmanniella sp.]
MDPTTAKMAVQIAATLGRNRGLRYLLIGLVVLALAANAALVFGPWILATQMSAALRGQQQALTDGGSCTTPTGPAGTEAASAGSLSAAQVGYARTIWQVGEQLGAGDRGGVVGIATALQESTLRNLSYGDRDSVGLFQQRAGWGSVETRMNPRASARLFYSALLKVPGWKDMSVTRAAQAVQRSAFPDAYAKHEKAATGLVVLFRSKAPRGTTAAAAAMGSAMCGNADAAQCPTTGMGIEAGLTPDALRVLRCLKHRWPQLTSFGGVGNRPSNVDRDHQEGRAVDAMVADYQTPAGKQLGNAIASWVVANQSRLGVRYVIWNARIWNVQRASEGWRTCGSQASCYAGADDSAAHRDHVHISVFGDQAAAPLPAGGGPVVRPLDRYLLTARFGQCSSRWANCHTGLDFAAGVGVPIRAIMGGRVTWTTWGGAYGNLTKIQHANGVQSWYAHQSSRRVGVGDTVESGQVIGTVGATGNVTGPHLHFEVRLNGAPVDPDRWLSARGVAP